MHPESIVQSFTHHRLLAFFAFAAGALFLGFFLALGPLSVADRSASTDQFVVPRSMSGQMAMAALIERGYVQHPRSVRFALFLRGAHVDDILPGAYEVSAAMSAWRLAGVLAEEPHRLWVVIPEGYRKEQIAEVLAETLEWSDDQKAAWIMDDTSPSADEKEGVYFPDSYLLSKEQTTGEVAERLRLRFDEVFSEYTEEAERQNIRWTTVLKVASLVQREASNDADMPLIAGILWNRLLNGQKLDVDATVQYLRDTEIAYDDDGYVGVDRWWAPIAIADKSIDSPFNTYRYAGLPPHPIANPGRSAIEAALFPQNTNCFYYLHASDGETHCAATYDAHLNNIERYL